MIMLYSIIVIYHVIMLDDFNSVTSRVTQSALSRSLDVLVVCLSRANCMFSFEAKPSLKAAVGDMYASRRLIWRVQEQDISGQGAQVSQVGWIGKGLDPAQGKAKAQHGTTRVLWRHVATFVAFWSFCCHQVIKSLSKDDNETLQRIAGPLVERMQLACTELSKKVNFT